MWRFCDIKPRIPTPLKLHERQISEQSIYLAWQIPRTLLYEYSFLVDQRLNSTTFYIHDCRLKNAITDL